MEQKDIYSELVKQYIEIEKQVEKYQTRKKDFPDIYTLAIVELHAQQYFIADLLIKHGKGGLLPKD